MVDISLNLVEGAPEVTFEELPVGLDLGQMDWSYTIEEARGLLASDDDEHPWFLESSPWGPPIIPMMATYSPVRLLVSRKFNLKGMFIQMRSSFPRPMFYETQYVLTGQIKDKWVKKGRQYVQFDASCRDAEGRLMFETTRIHLLNFSGPRQRNESDKVAANGKA